MNITCERCAVAFPVADASATQAACPSCQHVNAVPRSAGPREISLSSLDDEDDSIGLPTPAAPSAPSGAPPPALSLSDDALADVDFASLSASAAPTAPASPISLALADEPELPTPSKKPAPTPLRPGQKAAPPTPSPEIVDLPAPRTAPPLPKTAAPDAGVDLPTPRAGLGPTRGAPGSVDLPTPKVARPPVPSSPPPTPKSPPPMPRSAPPPTPRAAPPPPLPVVSGPPVAGRSLDAPSARAPGPPPMPHAEPSVSEPLDMMIPLDLDAPDVDDAPLGGAGVIDMPPVSLDLDSDGQGLAPVGDRGLDLPAPRSRSAPSSLADEETDLPTPVEETQELASRRASSSAPQHVAGAAVVDADVGAPLPRAAAKAPAKKSRAALIGGGIGVVALLGGGVAAWQLGVFGGGSARKEIAETVTTARKALAADSLVALRKAATALKPVSGGLKPDEEAALVEAQIHLVESHLGVAGELPQGKVLIEQPSTHTPALPDRAVAEGLQAFADGDFASARNAFKAATSANANDAAALSYLGWTELEARDLGAASTAFTQALKLEPMRAQALYGLALVKERQGDDKAALDGYKKTLAQSADHTRARIGVLRIGARSADADAPTQLEAVLAQAANLGKNEIAEAQVALGAIASDAGRVDEAEEHWKRALSLDPDVTHSWIALDASLDLSRLRVQSGHSADAITDLRKLIEVDPKSVEPKLLLAQALIEKRETGELEALLTAAEQMAPKDAHLALLHGLLLEAHADVPADDHLKAVEFYKAATTADPRLIEAWTALARSYHALGKTPDALDALSKAAGALSGNAHGAALVGETYLAIGQPAEAETRFRALLASGKPSPEQLPVWLGLGEALEAQNKLDEATKAYAEAQQLAPKNALFVDKQARIAVRQNKLDEAKRLFEVALKLGTPTGPLRLAAADLALTQHRYDDARTLAESVVKDDDRSAVGSLVLAKVELETSHPEEAIGLARRAAMLQDLPEAHLVTAQVLELTNRFDAAAAEYLLAHRPPSTDRAALGRARVLVRMGSTKDALVELAPLVKSGPLRADALIIEGDCYTDLQQPDKARKSYEDAAKLAPQSPDAAFKYGRAELDAGKRAPGIAAVESALKMAPPKTAWIPDAYFLVADAYRAGKQNEMAVRAYKKYMSIAPTDAPMRGEASKQLELLGVPPE